MAPSPSSSWRPTVEQGWAVIVTGGVVVSGLLVTAILVEQEPQRSPITWLAVFLGSFTQVGWVALDCRRRGVVVGAWRYLTFFFGPLAIAIYLGLAYGLRALYLVPLMVVIHLAVYAAPALVLVVVALNQLPD